MNDKLIIMFALDLLLLELDREYESLPDEVSQLIESKVYESYGLEVTSSKDSAEQVRKSMIKDIYNYRDELIKHITEN